MKTIQKILLLLCFFAFMFSTCSCSKSNTLSIEDTWQEQYDLGVRYLSEGNYEEAVIAFTAAIEIDPKRADTYLKLADAYIGLGDTTSALETLRTGIENADETDALISMLDEFERMDNIQWHADLSLAEDEIMKTLMDAFVRDDFSSIQDSVRSDALRELILEHGISNSSSTHFEFDYGNTINGTGMYISLSTNSGIELYYGTWCYGALDGDGLYCRYWWPSYDDWTAGAEDWTFTHATFKEGLADGTCERVRYHPIGMSGVNGVTVYDCVTTVSGTTLHGLWHGAVTERQAWGTDQYVVSGTFDRGIVAAVSEDEYGIDYGVNPDTGESLDKGPDGCGFVDFMGYWDVCDPVSGTQTSVEDPAELEYMAYWKIESLSLKENYEAVFELMSHTNGFDYE